MWMLSRIEIRARLSCPPIFPPPYPSLVTIHRKKLLNSFREKTTAILFNKKAYNTLIKKLQTAKIDIQRQLLIIMLMMIMQIILLFIGAECLL